MLSLLPYCSLGVAFYGSADQFLERLKAKSNGRQTIAKKVRVRRVAEANIDYPAEARPPSTLPHPSTYATKPKMKTIFDRK